jgi:hypothetical protein
MTKDIFHSDEAIIISVECKERLANCFKIRSKFLFYDSFQNINPIFNHQRLLVSVLGQLLDYHTGISVSLTLGIILHKIQLWEKCFFKQVKVHSLCRHAGSLAFYAGRHWVKKVIHREAHINVLNRDVLWQIEKHIWLKNILFEDVATACEVKCRVSLFCTLEHSLKRMSNMRFHSLWKMGFAKTQLFVVNLSTAVSCLALVWIANLPVVQVYSIS